MMESLGKKRIGYIDSLKGFAIICVVLGHVLDGYIGSYLWPSINTKLKAVFQVIYAFHMPLFFVLSGYLYSLSNFDAEHHIKKEKLKGHLVDYIWLYLIFCLLIWISKLLMSDEINNTVESSSILMIWAIPMPSYWYLYVLVAFYLLFAFVVSKGLDERLVTGIVIVICLLSNVVSGSVWFQIHRIMYYAVFFWIGIQKQRNSRFSLIKPKYMPVQLSLSVVLMVLFWGNSVRFDSLPVVNLIIAVGFVSLFWCLFEKLRPLYRGGYTRLFHSSGSILLKFT